MGFAGNDLVDGGSGTNTIVLMATADSLNTALDGQIVNIQVVSAATSTVGVAVALVGQTEAFILTGGLGDDTLAGGSGADKISAGAGADTINGFVGIDSVDGGVGTDTINLLSSSDDLNAASDGQIAHVEIISAANALSSVTINLSRQLEGLRIVGSAQADELCGGAGADVLIGGAGDDRFIGLAGALNYDEDGTGVKDGVQIATLKLASAVGLSYHDFLMIA